MTEKAKGIVTKIEKKTTSAGKEFYFATVGGVRLMIWDKKINDYLDKEVELEYTTETNEYGTTFKANFPGAAKQGGAPRKMSAEELKFKAIDAKLRTKTMIFSYAKDIVIANAGTTAPLSPNAICKEMEVYITFMLGKVAGNIAELKD